MCSVVMLKLRWKPPLHPERCMYDAQAVTTAASKSRSRSIGSFVRWRDSRSLRVTRHVFPVRLVRTWTSLALSTNPFCLILHLLRFSLLLSYSLSVARHPFISSSASLSRSPACTDACTLSDLARKRNTSAYAQRRLQEEKKRNDY